MTSSNGNKPAAEPASRVLTDPSTLSGGPVRLLPWSRWAVWVRALTEKWSHGFERNHRLAMILLRPLTVTRLMRERWMLKCQLFSPKINLSVQVLLKGTAATVIANRSSRELAVYRRSQAGGPLDAREPGQHARLASRVEVSGFRAEDREPTAFGRIESISPLERIFARNESLVRFGEANNTSRFEPLVELLTEKSRRVESNFPASATTPTRPVVVYSGIQAGASSAASDKAETPSHIAGFDGFLQPRLNREPGWDSSQLPRGDPAISIERLTDQVIRQLDRRVVAARERVGRTF